MRSSTIQQRGMVLITCLVFLLIATLIGIATTTSSLFEERMVANTQEKYIAFQNAESALRQGEAAAFQFSGDEIFSGTNGRYVPQNCNTYCWWDNTVVWNIPQAKRSFIIESLDKAPLSRECSLKLPPDEQCYVDVYRVTGRGNGNRTDTVSTIQSIVKLSK